MHNLKQVLVAFYIYKYFRKFLSTLHGVRIVWIFTLLDELFLCAITRRRGVFHSSIYKLR